MEIFMHTNVRLYSDGLRFWPTTALVAATCQVMVYHFPFDSQVTMQIIVQKVPGKTYIIVLLSTKYRSRLNTFVI